MKTKRCERPFKCSECDEPVSVGDRMVVQSMRSPKYNQVITVKRPLCFECGKLLAETED